MLQEDLRTSSKKHEQWGDSHSFPWPPLGPGGVPLSLKDLNADETRICGFHTEKKRYFTVDFSMKVKRKVTSKEKPKDVQVWVQLPKGKWPLQVGILKNIKWNHFSSGFILKQATIFSLMLNLALLGDNGKGRVRDERKGLFLERIFAFGITFKILKLIS